MDMETRSREGNQKFRKDDRMNFEKMMKEEYPLPLSCILDVNHNCNFECEMCVKRTMKNPHGQLSLDTFTNWVDKFPYAREISIGALGDPFYYKDIDKAMRYLFAKKIRTSVTSNGTTLIEENIKKLPPGSTLHISIDEGHKKEYKKAKTNFKKIKENIELVRKNRPDLKININCLLFKNSIMEAKGLIALAAGLKVGIIFFYPMYFTKKLEKKLSTFRKKDYKKDLEELLKLCQEWNVPFSMSPFELQERQCTRALTQPIVAFDGTVYPCDYVYQDIEGHKEWTSWYKGKGYKVPQEQYKMGNINNSCFSKIWNSKKYKKLRALIQNLNMVGCGKSFDEMVKEVDLDKEFEHCKVCLARWSRCL